MVANGGEKWLAKNIMLYNIPELKITTRTVIPLTFKIVFTTIKTNHSMICAICYYA